MKKQLGFYSILACVAFFILNATLFSSCAKKLAKEHQSSKPALESVKKAENFFTLLVAKEKRAMAGQTVPKSNIKAHDRLSKIAESVAWDKALEYHYDDIDYIMVPFNEDIKPFKNKNYEFVRNLIFIRDKKKFDLNILEILSDKGKSLGGDLTPVINAAFKNMHFNTDDPIDGLNASILLFDNSYAQQKSFHVTDGKWVAWRIVFRSDLEITQ